VEEPPLQLDTRRRSWLYLLALLGVAEPIVAFDIYALAVNDSAHTSLPTRWLAWGLAAVALLALVAWWAERRARSKRCRLLALAILLTGLLGAANVLLFEHYNVLMSYETWVERRLPAKYAPPGQVLQIPGVPPRLPDAPPPTVDTGASSRD